MSYGWAKDAEVLIDAPTAGTPTIEAWEYAVLQADKDLIPRVNDLDVEGWHLVNVISADAGWHNRFAAIVRRAIDPLPHPDTTDAGWYPDPAGRHEARYWNGTTWTHCVGDGGRQGRDAPTLKPPTPGLIAQ
jgi:Protein of unknown function (DUF2510)